MRLTIRAALAWLLALLLCAAQPAAAAIGFTSLGTITATSGGSVSSVITTSADCPVGATALAVLAVNNNNTGQQPSSVTDNAATPNTYTQGSSYAATGGQRFTPYYSIITTDLPASGQITGTWAGNSNSHWMVAACITGLLTSGVVDLDPATGTTGSWLGSTLEFTTATTNAASEAICAIQYIITGGSDSFTEDAAWTTINHATVSANVLRLACRSVSSLGTYTYTPTLWGTARTVGANYISFKASAAILKTPASVLIMMFSQSSDPF